MKHILLVVTLTLSPLAMADRVFLEEPRAALPADVENGTLKELIRSSVTGLGHEIVERPEAADYSLRPGVARLGSTYLVSIEKWRDGKALASTKLKAREVEEIDEIVERVVRALLSGVQAKDDARPNDVTIDETMQGTRRKFNRSGSLFAAGPSTMGGLHAAGFAFYLSAGHGWAIGPLLLGWRWDFAINPGNESGTGIFTDFNLNVTAYFMERDISPFATIEYGYGLGRDGASGDVHGGMVLGGILGVALFRTYAMHAEIGFHGAAMVSSSFPVTPVLGALRIGVAF